MKDEIQFWQRNPVKTFPMEDGIGVFGDATCIHQAARKGKRQVHADDTAAASSSALHPRCASIVRTGLTRAKAASWPCAKSDELLTEKQGRGIGVTTSRIPERLPLQR